MKAMHETPTATWIALGIGALVVLGGLSGDHFNIPQALVSCPGRPAILKVTNIAEGEFLPLKSEPTPDSVVVGRLPHNGRNLGLHGCRTVAGHKYRWCRVISSDGAGWADSFYLTVQKTELSTATHVTGATGGCKTDQLSLQHKGPPSLG